ncbi:HNT [Lepeophtheirus salmonis]|uniref:HNT n=1 Tax=Lepeophtheirus salmonis TaxID=72036 RepID=A0A7R8CPR4_LEPSM|nr:HNT [Lepeophtheirus salmonis]CAF2841846.1 HNT [Lepeophtheirus salmonis]
MQSTFIKAPSLIKKLQQESFVLSLDANVKGNIGNNIPDGGVACVCADAPCGDVFGSALVLIRLDTGAVLGDTNSCVGGSLIPTPWTLNECCINHGRTIPKLNHEGNYVEVFSLYLQIFFLTFVLESFGARTRYNGKVHDDRLSARRRYSLDDLPPSYSTDEIYQNNNAEDENDGNYSHDEITKAPGFTADVGKFHPLLKVAWVRVDTQTILTIHHNIITRNQRVSLSHHDHKIWRLHLNRVEEQDRGWYMCQINTDPMRSKRGYLQVVVAPLIIDSMTTRDVQVREGAEVNMTCNARGFPTPKIIWKREDGELIRILGDKFPSVDGNSLIIPGASRVHMGAYFCIASNGIPPSISKRIELKVQFAPMVWVQNQLEGAAVGDTVTLKCHTESYPQAIHMWTFNNGSLYPVSSGTSGNKKYRQEKETKNYVTYVRLHIRNVSSSDFGTYACFAKNSLGESDGTIKLYEIIRPTTLRNPFDEYPVPTLLSTESSSVTNPRENKNIQTISSSTSNDINNQQSQRRSKNSGGLIKFTNTSSQDRKPPLGFISLLFGLFFLLNSSS